MSTTLSLYEVLGLETSASYSEIKSAYRRLARACHPDVVAFDQKQNSANEFMKIHSAYSTLSDPDKRANYDNNLFLHRRRPFGCSSPAVGFSKYSSCTSNWETDQCW